MQEEQSLIIRDATTLPDADRFKAGLQAIRQFQAIAKSQMIQGHDYGVIPGTDRPTLLKPGAEKIVKLLGLADEYQLISETENWEKPFFEYKIKAQLRHLATGTVIAEGLGECNSYEAKYRYRWVFPRDVPAHADKATLVKREGKARKTGQLYVQYRIDNDDIFSQVNTLLKMAKKRALVDAALSASRLSDVFTQDIEDFMGQDSTELEEPPRQPAEKMPAPAEPSVSSPPEGKGQENAKEGPKRAYPKPTADDLGALRYYAGKIAAQYKETADVRLARICKAQMVEKIEDLTADQVAQIVASLKEALKPGNGAK